MNKITDFVIHNREFLDQLIAEAKSYIVDVVIIILEHRDVNA
jgi:hypothetical protein